MDERNHRNRRLIAVIAATVVSLACGTNYAYSAWAPQFAEKLRLSATSSNLVGTAGNMGMYATGIPLGYLCDRRGPYINTVIGAVATAGGYYPLYRAYESGAGSMGVPLLCIFSFITGIGSCAAFTAAIKTAALNWPLHRGSATAFPLAAFGLSAFFFTSLSGLLFPNSTSKYLLLLVIGTFIMIFLPLFFYYVPGGEVYHAISTNEEYDNAPRNSNALQRPASWHSKFSKTTPFPTSDGPEEAPIATQEGQADEDSSLLSNESIPGDIEETSLKQSQEHQHSHHADITGVKLLRTLDFWILLSLLAILSGCGLMTINNIGNDSNALWRAYAPNTPREFIIKRQLMHVSIISCGSFVGRLLSGVGSDVLVKKLHMSRFWCLVASGAIFGVAQLSAVVISDPYLLWIVSSLSGLGYGALFGVYPALTADAFGVSGLSQNWGYMTLAPVIGGNILNIWYGFVFDSHSKKSASGELVCDLGLDCYRNAYWLSSVASILGIVVSLGTVYRDSKRMREAREGTRGPRVD